MFATAPRFLRRIPNVMTMMAEQVRTPITSVLVANRGEIAVRIMGTLRRMGIRSIAVFSDADADAPHVRLADTAIHIGPTPAVDSYVKIERIIAAALTSGADAVHPGYGFLSENVDFATALEAAGIIFIGPPIQALEAMGDKIRAKQTAIAAGVPVVAGRHDPGMSDEALMAAAGQIGYPVLLKPSAGGGGKGMRIVREPGELAEAITSARREARGSFGDDTLLIERFVTRPRHIEVQVFGDTFGNIVHLGERECSLQRRHQKVIEEAPSPLLDAATRADLCESAVRLARAVGYVGAGTVEYVVPADAPSEFAFLEMNTRLQVEHPVTEMITGIDLVEWQVRVAAGEHLPLAQQDISFTGHAIEARVYAEDPRRGFIPTGGDVVVWEPSRRARVDAGIDTGSSIGTAYDPMLAKIITHGPDRAAALVTARDAVADTVLLGVSTNLDFLGFLLGLEEVVSGDLDTALIERIPVPQRGRIAPHVLVAAAQAVRPQGVGVGFSATDSWRVGGGAPWVVEVDVVGGDERHQVAVLASDRCTIDGVQHPITEHSLSVARLDRDVWVHDGVWRHDEPGGTTHLRVTLPIERSIKGAADTGVSGTWVARSPMPGSVVDIPVVVGASVGAGDPVVVVEAMKMEHTLRAPGAGTVTAIRTTVGAQVRLDEELVEVELPSESDDQPDSEAKDA
jgi:acetyl-CoA/propionyl-CoA carboxylase biotin carboxyl carrier protein